MQGVTTVSKKTIPLTFSPNLLYYGGNAGVSAGLAVFCVVILPKQFLVDIKVCMGVVHLNDGQSCNIF